MKKGITGLIWLVLFTGNACRTGDRDEGLAFMYASTNPEHYREALRKTLDQYLE